MPSEFGPEDEVPGLRIVPAPVMDFQFGLFLLTKYCIDPEKWVPPWVNEVSEEEPGLVERFMAFWTRSDLAEIDGRPYREWGEFLVAAWHTGTIFAERVETFLDAIEPAFAAGFEVPTLDSEPDDVRQLIAKRVEWLHHHAEDRAELLAMVRAVWKLVEPHWERFGRDGAAMAARDLASRASSDVDLRTLVPGNSFLHKEAVRPRLAAARARNELVIVPLGLAGGGQFYWAFPGISLIGTGIDSAEREARRKERAERAANKLKVLSDPTRVGILYQLLRASTHHPATVTELASQFGLSQPTVSVHVKMLREAGLARAERDGNQVLYQADESTIRSYVEDALDDVLQKSDGRSSFEMGNPSAARPLK